MGKSKKKAESDDSETNSESSSESESSCKSRDEVKSKKREKILNKSVKHNADDKHNSKPRSSKRRSSSSASSSSRDDSVKKPKNSGTESQMEKSKREMSTKHSDSEEDERNVRTFKEREHKSAQKDGNLDRHSRQRSRYSDKSRYSENNADDRRGDSKSGTQSGSRPNYRSDYKRNTYGGYKHGYKSRNRDGSPYSSNRRDGQSKHERFDRNRRRRSRSRSFDHKNAKWGKEGDSPQQEKKGNESEKQKPNFGLSGKLTEETNTYKGVVIKYSEPPEARKPKRRWRLYPFKGEKAMQTLYIHRESAYLIGRDRKVVDLPVDHPSCSKQHAALQYRLVPFTREDGSTGKRVRPYIIDLDSANGTYINNKKIDPRKYVELLEKDVIKFGYSSREYVLLHENSKDEALDDDVKQEEEEIEIKKEPE